VKRKLTRQVYDYRDPPLLDFLLHSRGPKRRPSMSLARYHDLLSIKMLEFGSWLGEYTSPVTVSP
jgi:hypothetical protein